MKKILLISSILISSVFSFNSVLAQTAGTISDGIVVATVNIYNARVISQADRNLAISFDISNKIGAQSQIRYAVLLTEAASKGVIADEKIYGDAISLGENASVSEAINYSIPKSLPSGSYKVWIESKNESGLNLATAFVSQVKVISSNANTIEIVPGSCYFLKTGSENHYDISGGASINSTDTLSANCAVMNNFSKTVSAVPSLETRIRSSFGSLAEVSGGSKNMINLLPGRNSISVELPKVSKPQEYAVIFSLLSEDGKIKSNESIFNYVLEGESGTIQNAVFDNDFYKAGDIAHIQVFSTISSVSPASLRLSVEDNLNISCSSSTDKVVSQGASVLNIEVPINRDCVNPKANIILFTSSSDKNSILDSKDFAVTTPDDKIPKMPLKANSSLLAIILIAILIVLLGIILIIRMKRKNKNMNTPDSSLFLKSLIVIILGLSIFGASKSAFADTVVYNLGATSVTFTTNLDQSAYNPGDKIIVTSSESGNLSPYSVASTSGAITGPISGGGGGNPTTGPSTTTLIVKSPSTSGTNFVNITAPSTVGSYTFDITDTLSSSTNKLAYPNRSISQQISFAVDTNPKINISSSPNPVLYNSSTLVSWNATNSTKCDIYIGSNIFGTPWKTNVSGYLSSFGSFGAGNGQFVNPSGTAIDSSGNIYVVDSMNSRVEKFSSAGTYVSQFGSTGSGNGQLRNPSDIAIDSSGNIYIVDSGNNRVEKFSSVGTYVSQIGSFGAGNGQLKSPYGIAFDSSGNIYVTDSGNNRVEKFSSAGTYVSQFGTSGIGNGQFTSPYGIVIDSSGNIYVVDSGNNRVEKFSSVGTYVSQFASGAPTYIALDSSGNIYVAESGRIEEFNSAGTSISQFSKSSGPLGISIDSSGNIYVANSGSDNVDKFNFSPISGSASYGPITSPTTFTANCTNSNSGPGIGTVAYTQVGIVPTVTISAASTTIPYNTSTMISWVSNGTNNSYQCTINKTPNASSTNPWKTVGTYISQFPSPQNAITVDSSDNLYVAGVHNTNQSYISKFDSSGNLIFSFDINTYSDYSSGSLINYSAPVGIAVDSSGNIYTIDIMIDSFTPGYVNLVRKFGPTGNYINQLGYIYIDNGSTDIGYGMPSYRNGGYYNFQQLTGITYDKNLNRLYVANYGRTPLGSYTGGSSRIFTLDTNLGGGNIYGDWGHLYLGGIAADSNSNYYLADLSDGLIQKFNSSGGLLTQWSTGSGGSKVAVDSQNNVYASLSLGSTCQPSQNGCIPVPQQRQVKEFDSNGGSLNQFGTYGSGLGQFTNIGGVAADSKNNIYVVDSNRTQKFNLNADTATSSGLLITTTVFDISCVGGGYTATSSVTVNVGSSTPPILSMGAAPNHLNSGQSTTLTWTVDNASSYTVTSVPSGVLSFSNANPLNPETRSQPVVIPSQTTFTLLATGPGGTVSTTTTVYMYSCPSCGTNTPTLTLTASPSTINSGQSTTLTWSSQYADSCTVSSTGNEWSGSKALSGSQSVTINNTGTDTFSMTCTNSNNGSSINRIVSVTVNSAAPGTNGTIDQVQCTPLQSGSSTPILINKTMAWTIKTNASASITGTSWIGKDIALTGITTPNATSPSATTLNKIYTTIGIKNISATSTGTLGGIAYKAACATSTVVTSSGGGGGEI